MLTDGFVSGSVRCPWPGAEAPESLRNTQSIGFEAKWRYSSGNAGDPLEEIVVTRWADDRNKFRFEEATVPSTTHIISIALKSTRLKLVRDRQTIFDGDMPAGTLHISPPSSQLCAEFLAPFDFLHFHVPSDIFSADAAVLHPHTIADGRELIVMRDPFAEQLGKALTEQSNAADLDFARCIGRTLVMHVARLRPSLSKVAALPKWRLKRVEEYIQSNLDSSISLSDLARVAGLSRMHFAAQFRAATGYRPHEFLLHQRIQHAKHMMSHSGMQLADVALATGFRTQAHFSTVFKRLTDETPARWRDARRCEGSLTGRQSCDLPT